MTTDMTIFKSLKYSCPRICNIDNVKIIDWICTCSKLIFQPESNKHYIKTENQKTHDTNMRNQNKQGAKMTKSQKQMKEGW